MPRWSTHTDDELERSRIAAARFMEMFSDNPVPKRGESSLTRIEEPAVDSWDIYLASARCPECGGPGYLLPGSRTALRHKFGCRFHR
jgi:hypothetical protein